MPSLPVSSGPLCLLILCAFCSCVLCSLVPSVPVSSVPLCPLFLCAFCSSVSSVPLCLLLLCLLFLCVFCSCVFCSSVSSVPLSSVPVSSFPLCLLVLCPLFLCAFCSSVSSIPVYPFLLYPPFFCSFLFLCSHCFGVHAHCFSLPLFPLFFSSSISIVCFVDSISDSMIKRKPQRKESIPYKKSPATSEDQVPSKLSLKESFLGVSLSKFLTFTARNWIWNWGLSQ